MKDEIIFMTIIAERKQRDLLLSTLSTEGINFVNVIFGQGTAKSGLLLNTFGFVSEQNKVVISCLTKHCKADEVLRILIEKFNFDKPNTGIAFTIPVGKISF